MQQPLTGAERKAKRSESQRLGKAIVLQQLGQKGITPAFIESAASALVANEFIKVRVGGGEELKEVAEELEKAIDCIVVHKIGFVLTLYRDKSLPPPACLGGPKDALEASEIEAEAKNKKKAKRKQPSAPEGPPPPPEFTVIE
jgi:RNA-binding protein YhbY